MDKIYCWQCFAEIPGYANFCHLCGAMQPDNQHNTLPGETPPPGDLKNFNTEFAWPSADIPHSEDATLPSNGGSGVLLQANVDDSLRNGPPQVSTRKPSDMAAETPPAIPAVLPPPSFEDMYPTLSSDEYNDIYYAALRRKEDLDAIASQPTISLKEDESNDVLLWPGQPYAPAQPRAEHLQPQMMRAEHLQAQTLRAAHQQAPGARMVHRQPQMVRAAHEQPMALSRVFLATHRQTILYSLVGTGVLLLVGLVVLLTNPFANTDAQQGAQLSSPVLAVMSAGKAFPGGSVRLLGRNFTSGATVVFKADGTELAQNSGQNNRQSSGQGLATISSLAALTTINDATSLHRALLNTRVGTDGTFDVVIPIPSSWQVKSTHTIQAEEMGSDRVASTDIIIQPPGGVLAAPKATPRVNPTPKAPPIVSNPTLPPLVGANPTPQQLPPVMQNPTVSAQPPVGTNSVQPATLKSFCPHLDEHALSFSIMAQGANPDSQVVLLNNSKQCAAGYWAASSDSLWLGLTPDNGYLATGKNALINIGLSTTNLSPGSYTGHIRLSPGGEVITVALTVQQAPAVIPCEGITASTGTLNFTSNVSFPADSSLATYSQPSDQTITITAGQHCAAMNWSVTSDMTWLAGSGGGSIAGGGSGDAQVHVSVNGLDASEIYYTGHLTFLTASGQSATVTVNLNFVQETPTVTPVITPVVTPIITPTTEPVVTPTVAPVITPTTAPVVTPTVAPLISACITTQTGELNFSSQLGSQGASQPADQTATIANGATCGASDWKVSSDASWLVVTGGGHIDANGVGNAGVHIDLNGLDTSKTYTGHVLFEAGASKASTLVNLSFSQPAAPPTPTTAPVVPTPTTAPVVPTPTTAPVVPTPTTEPVIPTPTTAPVIPTTAPVAPTPTTAPILIPTPTAALIAPKPVPIAPPTLTQCIRADQASLGFQGDNGYKGYDPLSQRLTVTNCGSTGIITATVSPDSMAWLGVVGGGKLPAAGNLYISVSADALKSQLSPGPHSGTIYITIKTSDGNTKNIVVSVLFTVAHTAPPPPPPPPPGPTQPPVPPGPTPTQPVLKKH